MNGAELKARLAHATDVWAASAGELRELDAAVGDGDLGITVSAGSAAIRESLAALGEDATPAEVLLAAAKAFADANPSTFAALVASGLLRGSKAIEGDEIVGVEEAVKVGRAAFEGISQRGKSRLGDKTILDALGPSVDALEEAVGSPFEDAARRAVMAARQGVEKTSVLVNRKGRAGWVGERTAGRPDPGATAYLRFLEAWEQAGEGS